MNITIDKVEETYKNTNTITYEEMDMTTKYYSASKRLADSIAIKRSATHIHKQILSLLTRNNLLLTLEDVADLNVAEASLANLISRYDFVQEIQK